MAYKDQVWKCFNKVYAKNGDTIKKQAKFC